ncbi:YciI family protein [Hyphomonas johnsonii]|uniref:YCII-related domain-containing protein n=1 Tax=Hyphomonas johnsonii MHS-2 TaxID=1280950 RepID=A0A059FNL8_9PROT|nr:YciI family protein [Hyphomonas johnsonii]KCZ92285.1 hypothetical protein HJO_09629 [Hyphomonas johnsonii MHS-2]
MPLYSLHCLDKEDGGAALRAQTRPAHLAWAAGLGSTVRMAGPLISADGAMVGSLFIVEADSLEDVRALSARDPYNQAGVFGRVDIHETRWSIGDGKPA